MSDKLRAAAERLPVNPEEYTADDIGVAARIVDAWLAEHAPQPIDEAYLMSIGGSHHVGKGGARSIRLGNLLEWESLNGVLWILAGSVENPTRGDVLRLVEALERKP